MFFIFFTLSQVVSYEVSSFLYNNSMQIERYLTQTITE